MIELLLAVLIVVFSVLLLSVGAVAGRGALRGSCANANLREGRVCPVCGAEAGDTPQSASACNTRLLS